MRRCDEALHRAVADLAPAAKALRRLPVDEAAGVGAWLIDIAKAVAGASKDVNDAERAAIDEIAGVFGPPPA